MSELSCRLAISHWLTASQRLDGSEQLGLSRALALSGFTLHASQRHVSQYVCEMSDSISPAQCAKHRMRDMAGDLKVWFMPKVEAGSVALLSFDLIRPPQVGWWVVDSVRTTSIRTSCWF